MKTFLNPDLFDQTPPTGDGERGATVFRRDAFFFRPWWGSGLAASASGRPLGRYQVRGDGRFEGDRAWIRQTWTFETGQEHTATWDVIPGRGDELWARDPASGVEAHGRPHGHEFLWTFETRAPTPFGRRNVKVEALYSLRGPDQVQSVTRIKLFGLTTCTLTTFYSPA